jgi:hypothetical protein
MLVTKKEHRVEGVNGEPSTLDNIGVFFSNALRGFRGRFPFAPSEDLQLDHLRQFQAKGESQG